MHKILDRYRQLIINNRIEKAFDELEGVVKYCSKENQDSYKDSEIILRAISLIRVRHNSIKEERIRGTISIDDERIERINISSSLLLLLSDFPSYPDFFRVMEDYLEGKSIKSNPTIELNNDENKKVEYLIQNYYSQVDYAYDLFLSFSREDIIFARNVWQECRKRGLKVFFSAVDLFAGELWFDKINDAVANSKHFLLLASESSLKSKWVNIEYKTFYEKCILNGSNSSRKFFILEVQGHEKDLLPILLSSQVQASKSIDEILQQLSKEIDKRAEEYKVAEVEIDTVEQKPILERKTSNEDIEELPDKSIRNSKKWIYVVFSIVVTSLIVIVGTLLYRENKLPTTEQLDFEAVLDLNDIGSLKIFVDKYPFSKHRLVIEQKIDSLLNVEYSRAIEADDIAVINSFIDNNPEQTKRNEVLRARLEVLSTDKPLAVYSYDRIIRTAKFYKEGIVATTYDGQVQWYSYDNDRITPSKMVKASRSLLTILEIHDYGIFCGGADNTVYAIDMASSSISSLHKHNNDIVGLFTPSKDSLVSISMDGKVKIWSSKNERIITSSSLSHRIFTMAYSENNNLIPLITFSKRRSEGNQYNLVFKNSCYLYDFVNDEITYEIILPERVSSVRYLPDGEHLLIAGLNIYLWNIRNKKIVKTFEGHDNYVRDIDVSTRGDYFVTGGDDNLILIWAINNSEPILKIPQRDGVLSVDLDDKNHRLLVTDKGNQMLIWDVRNFIEGI